jgi:hypothetical protein
MNAIIKISINPVIRCFLIGLLFLGLENLTAKFVIKFCSKVEFS